MSMPRFGVRRLLAVTATVVLAAAALVAQPAAGLALALPTPKDFVAHLDLECFRTSPYTPPPTTVVTRHLNPLLANLPAEAVTLGAREQLCVPVAKNGVLPPQPTLDFVRYVDLSCYRVQGAAINTPLTLSHLNPQLANLPRRGVTLSVPEQLCVPVVKNGAYPPAEVLRLVSYIDVKCYREAPQTVTNQGLLLSHLNPVLAALPKHDGVFTTNRQLCVPVRKNSQEIPADVLNIVRYVDLEKFDLQTAPLTSPVELRLNHVNPLLANLPAEPATLLGATQLLLPVAKNGLLPPA